MAAAGNTKFEPLNTIPITHAKLLAPDNQPQQQTGGLYGILKLTVTGAWIQTSSTLIGSNQDES